MTWSTLNSQDRAAAVISLSRQGLTEGQMEHQLGAPDGSIRTMARRLGVTITRERDRKAAEQTPDPGAMRGNNPWALDEGRRRQMIARRAQRGAREALRAFQ